MGKVYEALQRAEREESNRPLTAVPLPNTFNRTGTEAREAGNQFDFVDYSLTALPSDEVARRNQDAASAAVARRSLVEPARDVTLEMSRVDPHLTTFFDANGNASLVASEQFNKLAISIISQREERPLKKILIASTHRAEGRTCVALNLAGALARARQRVLVIDGDLNRPSLHRFLGIEAESGLADVVRKNLAPGQALIKVQPLGFDILPTREPIENPAELLTSQRFRDALAMLETEYDCILLDSSPLLRVNDANLLVRMTDATIFVIRAGKTSSLQLGKAVGSLTQDHVFGVVLNRAEDWVNGLNS